MNLESALNKVKIPDRVGLPETSSLSLNAKYSKNKSGEMMEKSAGAEILRQIAQGDVDLDKISELIRSSELVIRRYQDEIEALRRVGDQLELDLQDERKAGDDLVRRLTALHEENRLARQVFRTEIEGRRALIGEQLSLDLEALDMAALIREREKSQEDLLKNM